MKCFAGGPQDVVDARDVLAAAATPVDIDLLRRLARRFGRTAGDVLEQHWRSARHQDCFAFECCRRRTRKRCTAHPDHNDPAAAIVSRGRTVSSATRNCVRGHPKIPGPYFGP